MSKDIKSSAITSAGYIYQNRQGLKILCDWLDAPARYTRVKFECDNENEAPQGLDDIVIERGDGLLDLQQIKFTPDPEKYLLSWEWMLEKTGKTKRSRSMLRKWFDAFQQIDSSRLGLVSLTTNRRPDATIEACLEKYRICFTKIPEAQRATIILELGSVENCVDFFNHLHIRHSDKSFSALEQDIDARLRAHGTLEGIATLKNAALNWATQKNQPAPDGWITMTELRTILRASRPAPLPEDFVVPKGYEVPDETFHREFIRDAIKSTGKALVLTGPPGRGKSTYLSALCDALAELNIPTFRHHYFLSTTERGRDRINSYVVEQSIKTQIEKITEGYSFTTGGLRTQLEACSDHYKKLGKPFVLILDGLDHVWRINAEDKKPLEDLFSQLIPCPDNMVLLVGTQPVNDIQLPTDLLAFAPKAEWRTLPAMSEKAVLSYLRRSIQEGRLTTGLENARQAEEQLQFAASALRARTNGHPLHVIYSIAELEHAGHRLSTWDIEQLKGDMTQDVRFYYASLWEQLSPSQKDMLRLICAFPFFWPKTAFSEIASTIMTAEPDVSKLEHLLYSSPAGMKVFHESLAVFVRATAGYQTRINELMSAVENWLEHKGPASLRVNWLWTIQAKLGKPKNLISGLTRDWIMRRLEEGYPESLFETLLSDALVAAIETAKFADAYRLSHLKSRMVGGSSYQIQDADLARLICFTLTLTTEESVIREAIASRHETDILHIAALGLALQSRGDVVMAETCGEEALRRFMGLSRFSNRYGSRQPSDEFIFLSGAFAQLSAIGATCEALIRLIDKNHPEVWLVRVQMLINEGNLDELMTIAACLPNGHKKNILSDACIRAAAKATVNITERDDFNALARTPLVAAIEAALTRTSNSLNESIPVDWLKGDYYERKKNLATLAHHWFFGAVHLGICMEAENKATFQHIRAPVYEGRENISDFLDALSSIGIQIAKSWWRGEFVEFHCLFSLLEPVAFRRYRQGYDQSSAAEDFRAALHQIACDVRLGSILLKNIEDVTIPTKIIREALQCTWFDSASFCTQYGLGALTRMSDEAAKAVIRAQRSLIDAEVNDETSEYLQTPLQLCAIAITHNLIEEARELCTQTWELATGYGHRKDPTLSNTLDAISFLADVAGGDALRLLGQIAPQIHHVLRYTDGSGTRHILSETDGLLAKLRPSSLVTKYEEHIDAGDWSLAENSLQTYVKQGIIEGWPLDALMRTGLPTTIRDALQQLVQDGSEQAAERLCILEKHNGWDIGCLQRHDHAKNSTDSNLFEGDITTYKPEQLTDLLKSLESHYTDQPRCLVAWYQYWQDQKQGKKLLIELDKVLFSENKRMREALLLCELAFQTKRKMSGLPAAWKYLVHAQIHSGGWIGYMEREKDTHRRLDLVAQTYPHRCDEFVIKTTYGMFDYPASNRIAPSEAMVYFYIKQNRIQEAVEFTETMVNCVIEDTRTLPLTAPRWMTELTSHHDSGAQ